MSDPMIKLDAARSAEALSLAKKIKEKVAGDNATGWYTTAKPEGGLSLELTKESQVEALELLKKTYGVQLAAYMCGLDDDSIYKKWASGTEPNYYQKRKVRDLLEVTQILLSRYSTKQAKTWVMTPCEYLLYFLPMDEIRAQSELVRRAALKSLVTS